MHSSDVRREWAERSGEYSPAYYAHYGPDETSEAIRGILDRYLDRDARVLELGCSSGRHLAHLHDDGYDSLAGVELNDEAFEDGQFDAVYSVETLQHLHPEESWVFGDLCRITDDLLITVENEGSAGDDADHGPGDSDVRYVRDDIPLYHRDWHRVFTDLGLRQVETAESDRDTIRVFRSRPAE